MRLGFIQCDCHSNVSLQRVPRLAGNWSWFSLLRPLPLLLNHAIEHTPSRAFWKGNYRRKKEDLWLAGHILAQNHCLRTYSVPVNIPQEKSFPPAKVYLMTFQYCSKSCFWSRCSRFQEVIVSTWELDISVFMSLNYSGRNPSKNDPHRDLQKLCATCFSPSNISSPPSAWWQLKLTLDQLAERFLESLSC